MEKIVLDVSDARKTNFNSVLAFETINQFDISEYLVCLFKVDIEVSPWPSGEHHGWAITCLSLLWG